MKRGNKVTLYELMHQASETNDAKSSVRSESTARVIRLPIGFLYTGLVVVLLLLIALYAYGFHRGQVATEAKMGPGHDRLRRGGQAARTDQ